jgi:cysteine desulfurase/selenocysteine lyase
MISSLFDRQDFPTLSEYYYLNQASIGLIGRPAVHKMHNFIDDYARHGNCHMSDEDEAAYLNSLRAVGAKLFACPSSQVAIVAGASDILAQLPSMIRPTVGSTIVVVASDFPAITRPWLRQQILHNCKIHFVEDSQSMDLTDALIEAIDEDTSVVAVSSVQFATGTTVDINRISKTVSEMDARLIVDVTQDLGARSIDVGDWNADAVVCSGYKWLGGHGGAALAVMSPRLLGNLPPMTGWMGAPDPFNFDSKSLLLANDARRYTQSTMSYVSIACLTTAIEQLLTCGIQNIENHADKLANLLTEEVAELGWLPYRSPAASGACSHIVSLFHPEKPVGETMKALAIRKIICSSRGGRIRVSIAPYNDENDIDMLVQALK